MLDRRSFLALAGAFAASTAQNQAEAAAGGAAPEPATALRYGSPTPFSFDALIAEARDSARRPYVPPPPLPGEVLDRIGYDAHGQIKFRTEEALFHDGPGQYPVTFFPLGRYFRTAVHMYVLSGGGQSINAREILYDPAYFDMPADNPARQLPIGAGFAGFRLQESRLNASPDLDWHTHDWAAFLGASYFRAIGELYQYGLSARGVTIDVAVPGKAEEFPSFTRFYFEPPSGEAVTVYAYLEGPSITGAYRFLMRRERAVLMDIDCRLFLRRDVTRLGLAPMTSMYWFSETAKPTAIDWRPEVHDSDGLAMWNGDGERIWRPLNNPQHTGTSSFMDHAPRGLGLLQRDRVFDHYLDGVRYDRRPSLWVEPMEDWGAGSVQLVEIPTDDETSDNIVAMWVPAAAAKAGNAYSLRYRLYWSADEPHPSPLARCVATRLGRGGQPGQPRPPNAHKFVVEFLGGPLAGLPFGERPQPILTASRGSFGDATCEAVPDGVAGHWRAEFDLIVTGAEPVDMRLYLRNGAQTLSETWLYQFLPP